MNQALDQKITFIQSKVPTAELRIELSTDFASVHSNYRQALREKIKEKFTLAFSPSQLEDLMNLEKLPTAQNIWFSISHCRTWGGFSSAALPHGFDVECTERIAAHIVERMSSAEERSLVSDIKYLWVAKEAAYKAIARESKSYPISEIHCLEWESHSETGVQSFRIKTEKTLDLTLNRGFVFSEKDVLLAVFFR